MQIALWVAQFILDYIKSANNALATELDHQVRRNKELQANIENLRVMEEVYQQSLNALDQSNERLKQAVVDLRKLYEDTKAERNKIRAQYDLELEASTDEEILRAQL